MNNEIETNEITEQEDSTKPNRNTLKAYRDLTTSQKKAIESILAKKDSSEAFLRKLCTALKVTDLGLTERLPLANWLMNK